MIEIRNLTKTYGAVTAVDDLTVTIRPAKVTGFLGPNGAGKSTTMRAIVGLDRPDTGDVLIGGRRYADDPAPLHTVSALLDARALHPGRSARAHLHALAATHGIGRHRVDKVLDMVGLRERLGVQRQDADQCAAAAVPDGERAAVGRGGVDPDQPGDDSSTWRSATPTRCSVCPAATVERRAPASNWVKTSGGKPRRGEAMIAACTCIGVSDVHSGAPEALASRSS